jgi:hypothetical protein
MPRAMILAPPHLDITQEGWQRWMRCTLWMVVDRKIGGKEKKKRKNQNA